jgi:hypothetical protein
MVMIEYGIAEILFGYIIMNKTPKSINTCMKLHHINLGVCSNEIVWRP